MFVLLGNVARPLADYVASAIALEQGQGQQTADGKSTTATVAFMKTPSKMSNTVHL